MATKAKTSSTSDTRDQSVEKALAGDSALRLAPRVTLGLAELLKAHDDALNRELNDWEYSLDITFLRSLGMTNNDLRWLAGRGLVDHAVEVMQTRTALRSFRPTARPLFSERASFRLSPAGVNLAQKLSCQDRPTACGESARNENLPRLAVATVPTPLVPKWDRDRHELKLGSIVVKRFKLTAIDAETILAAFEDALWPARIDNPLPSCDERSNAERLRGCVERLNRSLVRAIVRFCADDDGQIVWWEFAGPAKPDGTQ